MKIEKPIVEVSEASENWQTETYEIKVTFENSISVTETDTLAGVQEYLDDISVEYELKLK